MSTLAVPGPEGTTTAGTTTQVPVAVPRTFLVDPQIQNVALLLILGVLGTLLNVALFAGALTRPRMPGSLGCAPPLAAALAQFAFGGLIEVRNALLAFIYIFCSLNIVENLNGMFSVNNIYQYLELMLICKKIKQNNSKFAGLITLFICLR